MSSTPVWLLCSIGLLATAAQAGPSMQTIGSTGGYVTTCIAAQTSGGGSSVPGVSLDAVYPNGPCSFDTFSGNGNAQAQQFPQAGDAISGGAVGSVSLGAIHLATQYSLQSPTAGNFPNADSIGGFNIQFTPQLQGMTGQAGYLLVNLDVSGGLVAHGDAGHALFQLRLYKDNAGLSASAPGYNPGTGTESSTDQQWASWRVQSFPAPFEGDTQAVDEMLTFSIPVIWGTQLQLGVYGASRSGGRNSVGIGSASADFSQSIYWAGVKGAFVGNQFIDDGLSIDSDSGLDWMKTMVPGTPNPKPLPEPGSLGLILAGLLAAKAAMRRHPA